MLEGQDLQVAIEQGLLAVWVLFRQIMIIVIISIAAMFVLQALRSVLSSGSEAWVRWRERRDQVAERRQWEAADRRYHEREMARDARSAREAFLAQIRSILEDATRSRRDS